MKNILQLREAVGSLIARYIAKKYKEVVTGIAAFDADFSNPSSFPACVAY
jgi:hypothetical protein